MVSDFIVLDIVLMILTFVVSHHGNWIYDSGEAGACLCRPLVKALPQGLQSVHVNDSG